MKSDVTKAKGGMKRELDGAAECADRDARSPVNMAIRNLLGDAKTPKLINAQTRVQSFLLAWCNDWKFPQYKQQHILQKDVAIPPVLRPEDMKHIKEEEGSDTDSDDSNEEGDDN